MNPESAQRTRSRIGLSQRPRLAHAEPTLSRDLVIFRISRPGIKGRYPPRGAWAWVEREDSFRLMRGRYPPSDVNSVTMEAFTYNVHPMELKGTKGMLLSAHNYLVLEVGADSHTERPRLSKQLSVRCRQVVDLVQWGSGPSRLGSPDGRVTTVAPQDRKVEAGICGGGAREGEQSMRVRSDEPCRCSRGDPSPAGVRIRNSGEPAEAWAGRSPSPSSQESFRVLAAAESGSCRAPGSRSPRAKMRPIPSGRPSRRASAGVSCARCSRPCSLRQSITDQRRWTSSSCAAAA